MEYCFTRSVFDKDLSKWNFNKDINCKDMFYLNHNFIKKYNNNEDFPTQTNDILKWFKKNREKMREINQGSREEILDFFSFDNNINIELKD